MRVQALCDWAAECRFAAVNEYDVEAKAAFEQLAAEFDAMETEIEGLLAAMDALNSRQRQAA